MSGRPVAPDTAGRLTEALLLTDPDDQESLDTLRETLEDVLPGLDEGRADAARAVRESIAALDQGGDDLVARVTAALGPALEPDAGPAVTPDADRALLTGAGATELTGREGTEAAAESEAAAEPETPAEAAAPSQAEPPRAASSLADDPELVREFVVSSREHLDEADASLLTLEQDNTDAEAVGAVFRSFHTIKGMAGFLDLQAIEDAAHGAEDTLDDVRKGAVALDQGVMDSLFAAVDVLRALVGRVGDGADAEPTAGDRGAAAAAVDRAKGRAGEGAQPAPADCDAATRPPVATAKAPAPRATSGAPAAPANGRGTVHVDEGRLDLLLETIGELVIAEASVSQAVGSLAGAAEGTLAQLGRLDKISRQLQEMATSMRMIPLRSTMRRMARLVRDLARTSGKPVDCVTAGEDVELDKSIVDGMTDSLVHLVRNAVDHGVEADPEERVRAGKPRTATVRISARHASGRIVIVVEDDGRGIDPDAVVARAREVGILGPDEHPAPEDVAHLLFTPGFSTRTTVTDVSGRGVGMDVVKRTAEALMGTVALSSVPGEGTTVRLTLPLTLAIIDGMLVRVGQQRYIIPALAIVRSQRIEPDSVTGVMGRSEMLATPQGLVPLIRLRDLFADTETPGEVAAAGMPVDGAEKSGGEADDEKRGRESGAEEPCDGEGAEVHGDGGGPAGPGSADDAPRDDICTIVSAADGSAYAGLVVTELLGQHQIVMKSLGTGLGDVTGVSGAAILGDGTVGLVIDVQQTVRLARGGKG